MTRHQKMTVWLVIVGLSVYLMGTDLYLPSLPRMARDFGVDEDLIQLTIAAFFVGSAIGASFLGALSDHYGRRPVLVIGLGIATIASFLAAISPNVSMLIICRFCQGLSGITATIIGMASIQDQFEGKQSTRVLSWLGSSLIVVPALAPILGGIIDVHFGWRYNLYFIFFSNLLYCVAAFYQFPETKKEMDTHPLTLKDLFGRYVPLLKHREFSHYILLTPLIYSGEWAFMAVLPFYLITVLSYGPEEFSYIIAIMTVAYVLGNTITNQTLNRISFKTMIFSGMSFILVGCGLFILTHFYAPASVVSITLSLCIYQLGMGIIYAPVVTESFSYFKSSAGAASSLRNTLSTVFAGLGALAASYFDDDVLLPTALYMAAVCLLSFFLFVRVQKIIAKKTS